MYNQKIINQNLINPEIAEILGAFIGDGWIESDKGALYITGSPVEDKLYYDNHLAVLFSKHFSPVKPRNFDYWSVYGISTYKKEVINKAIELGFQVGHKSLIAEIPEYFIASKDGNITKAVIRGIFDTDGSFWCEKSRAKTSTEWKRTHNYHPEMCISSCSRKLLEQVQNLLNILSIGAQIRQKHVKGFKNNRNINDSYQLNVRKIAEIEKFFKIIKPSNPRHQTRYKVWNNLGYLPTYTTIQERLNIIMTKLIVQ